MTLESTDPLDSIVESNPQLDQAPTSDLRSAPHSDQLSPGAVAKVEADKHEMDNNADATEEAATALTSSVEGNKTDAQPQDDQAMKLSQSMSPPPAPEPSHATLPAQPSNGTIVPSIDAVDTTISGEQPADPAPTPAIRQDEEMTDAPAPPVKTVHEREEEDNDNEEPAPKRVKTDEDHSMADQTSFKVPESPAPAAPASGQSSQVDPDDAVTAPRLQHMKKVVSNLKKSNASAAFRLPVDPVALKIPTYLDFVKKPMDLGTIDNRLKRGEYTSVQAFREDFGQILQNCIIFNGPDHTVTQQGRKMESSFNNQMQQLPPATSAEPPKVEKKVVKPKVEPIRAPVSRRQSVSTKAASPTAQSPATFALNPEGMPLIRRDSTVDGRPKRAIIPTKRNSDFGGARPKKKKYELELKFCDEALKNIMSNKHWAVNQYFMHPVDPVALNIPQYFQVIKKPMDLGTVRQKLDGGHYEKAKDFEEDVRLIFKNCFKFNPEGDYVHGRGQELEKLFNQEWSKKREWIAAREPDSEPASVGDDEGEDDASDEDVDAESEEDVARKTQLQQLEEQLELIKSQMGQLKEQTTKKKSPSVGAKKSDKKNKAKKEAPKTQFPGLNKNKTKKPATKAKPEKDRYVTFAEKQYISNGIAMLPERPMSEALKIIQNSVPALANSDQGEIELDIEEVPNHALLKLLSFVKKYAGPPPEESKEQEYVAPTVSKTKKSKTMSRQDQDAQIAELRGTLHHYQEGISPEAVQSIETGAEDSDDDDESNEESEEE